MAQTGEIDLSEVKAKYSVPDITFVDSRELDFANEFRTTFEISFSIGLTFLGYLLSNFSLWGLAMTVAFLGFGVVHLYRYWVKSLEIKRPRTTTSSPSTSPSSFPK